MREAARAAARQHERQRAACDVAREPGDIGAASHPDVAVEGRGVLAEPRLGRRGRARGVLLNQHQFRLPPRQRLYCFEQILVAERRLLRIRHQLDAIGLADAGLGPRRIDRVAAIDEEIVLGFEGLEDVRAQLRGFAIDRGRLLTGVADGRDQRRGELRDRCSPVKRDKRERLRDGEDASAERQGAAEQFDELRRERQQGFRMLAHERVETLLAEPDERGIAEGDACRRLRPVEQKPVFANDFPRLDQDCGLVVAHRLDDEAEASREDHVETGGHVVLIE